MPKQTRREAYRQKHKQIFDTFKAFMPFTEEVPIQGVKYKDTNVKGPTYVAGFYIGRTWTIEVWDKRNGAAYRAGSIELVSTPTDSGDNASYKPKTIYTIMDSGDPHANFFVALSANAPEIDQTWLQRWEDHVDAVISDMQLLGPEAILAKRWCGWHLVDPDPYFPRCIPRTMAVHKQEESN